MGTGTAPPRQRRVGCMATAPASRRSPPSGPSATAFTRSCASRTGSDTGAPLRSAATTTCSPATEGRHRLPRRRHHRQPRRQGPPARHTRHEGRRVGRTASSGRVVHPARPLSFCSDRDDDTNTGARLRAARRLRRPASRGLRRSFPAPSNAATVSPSQAIAGRDDVDRDDDGGGLRDGRDDERAVRDDDRDERESCGGDDVGPRRSGRSRCRKFRRVAAR